MSEYKPDGHVITNGEGSMGIFSATSYLNDALKENRNLKSELYETLKFINKAHKRSVKIDMPAYMIARMNKLKELTTNKESE